MTTVRSLLLSTSKLSIDPAAPMLFSCKNLKALPVCLLVPVGRMHHVVTVPAAPCQPPVLKPGALVVSCRNAVCGFVGGEEAQTA